jgi:hypothetical protein
MTPNDSTGRCYGCRAPAHRTRFVVSSYRGGLLERLKVGYWERVPVCKGCDEFLGRHPMVEDHCEWVRRVAAAELNGLLN